MKKQQFFQFTTIGLLLLNIALMAFLFTGKPKPPHHPPRQTGHQEAMKILSLDEGQSKNFELLVKKQRQEMNELNAQQKAMFMPYFESLVDNSKILQSDSLLLKLEQIQGERIASIYRHFSEVELLLRPNQKVHFEAFMKEALEKIFAGVSDRKRPPPPKGK